MIRVGISVVSNRTKNMTRLVAENVSSRETCSTVNVIRNTRFRGTGSDCRWLWLAMAISGRSQHDSVIRGAEIMSMFM